MNVRHPMGVLHSFFIKNIFYDEMDLRLFYFRATICYRAEILLVWSVDQLKNEYLSLQMVFLRKPQLKLKFLITCFGKQKTTLNSILNFKF